MLGNWSLGDYFKEEQIEWIWNFFTESLQLPKGKLYVTVFAGTKTLPKDSGAASIWKKLGIPDNHIFYYGPEKNWWSRAGIPEKMPAGEPGGPDSEIFFEFTNIMHNPIYGSKCHPNCDCGRFLEIGNCVFMQYQKQKDGTFKELPQMNVDFGGGLERMVMAIENKNDMFMSHLYQPLIAEIEILTAQKYKDDNQKRLMRIISDHLKASVFLIKDGVLPSNKEQGYVLRRLLRRSAVKMYQLTGKTKQYDFSNIVKAVLTMYENIYFQLKKDFEHTNQIINDEMSRFNNTLDRGLKEVSKVNKVTGKLAFYFYQSYGFPLELTEELFREKNQLINKEEFYKEFNLHKELSRKSAVGKFKGGLADHSEQTLKYHTATHLLHQSLFDVLGNDVRQEGSNITVDRLRFDFYSAKKPEKKDIEKAAKIINTKIAEKLPVTYKIIPKKEALKIGARSFFKEKYPEMVKVYFVGDSSSPQAAYSKEFCGGPHVTNTKEIGNIEIFKFEKIGSNLYRVYAR